MFCVYLRFLKQIQVGIAVGLVFWCFFEDDSLKKNFLWLESRPLDPHLGLSWLLTVPLWVYASLRWIVCMRKKRSLKREVFLLGGDEYGVCGFWNLS